ncbi:MAG TPA: response regulator [Candidatus Binatia bacterium]|nr:response regulator [Candidatus Binatia bacterium]
MTEGVAVCEPRRWPQRIDPARVLVAEDDPEMLDLLACILEREGYEVVRTQDGVGLLTLIESATWWQPPRRYDAIVSDVELPALNALDVLAGLRPARGSTPVVLVTAFGDSDTRAKARRLGVRAVLDKPLDVDRFRAVVREAMGQ